MQFFRLHLPLLSQGKSITSSYLFIVPERAAAASAELQEPLTLIFRQFPRTFNSIIRIMFLTTHYHHNNNIELACVFHVAVILLLKQFNKLSSAYVE